MRTADIPRVCVSIANETPDAALAAALACAAGADVIEIRLDFLANPDPRPFLAALKTPLLFTNRAAWEGGRFAGSEEERLRPLLAAAEAGAAFVDIELKTAQPLRDRLIAQAREQGARPIVSWHDFSGTPPDQVLGDILRDMRATGASIGKIVTTAADFRDVLRVLALQTAAHDLDFPLIAFAMGEAGRVSRAATCRLGGFMTYAAPDNGAATAPGQLPVSSLREILKRL